MAVLTAALCGLCVWTCLGAWVLTRLGWQAPLDIAAAPAVGWATQTTLSLILSHVIGLSLLSMLLSIALVIACAALLAPRERPGPKPRSSMPAWIYLLAALIAVLPASALLPKAAADGVLLSAPIFDHSKIALIDQMIREGVPPANPVFGDENEAGVSYYYLWHFAAAQLGRSTSASGWEADIAMTAFTAFSTLSLMSGLAFRFARRTLAPVFVLIISLTGSVRPLLTLVADQERIDRLVEPATGLGGWLFQTTWSPHHVASASCVVVAALWLAQLGRSAMWGATVMLGLMLAAAFQSSLWVGGIVCALAMTMVLAPIAAAAPRDRRPRIIAMTFASAGIAAAAAAPLLVEQLQAAAQRGGGLPIRMAPQYVLGPAVPEALRRALDIPAYWLVLLLLEFPVLLFAAFVLVSRRPLQLDETPHTRADRRALLSVALTSLGCGWLLFSTTGDNNDLGWRAVLPAVLVLSAAAGVLFANAVAARRWAIATTLAACALLALPDGSRLVHGFMTGVPAPSATLFARAPSTWAAVRRHTPPAARVANDPASFADLTPWPVNIGWALLANRRSCFAGNELALAFAPLPTAARLDLAARIARVFDGSTDAENAARLMRTLRCSVVLLTPQSGAWTHDPFAASPSFELVESREDEWRIYRVNP